MPNDAKCGVLTHARIDHSYPGFFSPMPFADVLRVYDKRLHELRCPVCDGPLAVKPNRENPGYHLGHVGYRGRRTKVHVTTGRRTRWSSTHSEGQYLIAELKRIRLPDIVLQDADLRPFVALQGPVLDLEVAKTEVNMRRTRADLVVVSRTPWYSISTLVVEVVNTHKPTIAARQFYESLYMPAMSISVTSELSWTEKLLELMCNALHTRRWLSLEPLRLFLLENGTTFENPRRASVHLQRFLKRWFENNPQGSLFENMRLTDDEW